MGEQLIRLGPVDDWVRTVAAHLRADVVRLPAERPDVDAALDRGGPVLLSSGLPGLRLVLTRLVRRDLAGDVAIGWIPDPDRDSRALGDALGVPRRPTLAADAAAGGPVRRVRLVRDEHGGLLLLHGWLTPAGGRGRRFGAQSYHDDVRIADGPVRRIEVRPDYAAACAVSARVGRRSTTGRTVQTSCDEAFVTVDGVRRERPVTRWTWYADPRQHWLLRTTE